MVVSWFTERGCVADQPPLWWDAAADASRAAALPIFPNPMKLVDSSKQYGDVLKADVRDIAIDKKAAR
jgi:hypothetical protein